MVCKDKGMLSNRDVRKALEPFLPSEEALRKMEVAHASAAARCANGRDEDLGRNYTNASRNQQLAPETGGSTCIGSNVRVVLVPDDWCKSSGGHGQVALPASA